MTLLLIALAASASTLYFLSTALATTSSAPTATTHMGKTAQQWQSTAGKWHRRAVWRTVQRDRARQSEDRLRIMLRHEIQIVGSHPDERNMLCIHSGEGSWSDPNAPYYGGMQMDMSFQRAYGPEFLRAYGTADNWPVSVQIAVSLKAMLSGRGYYPWPTTARDCGLIG